MKVAVLGSGGREHALVWKLKQSSKVEKVYALPGNGGIENSVPIDIYDFEAVAQFCKKEEIGYLVVGPEDLLAKGIVDFFEGKTTKVFGASQQAAQLESSKIFAKKFMEHYGVTTPNFEVFHSKAAAQKLIHQKKGNLVVKYDGLAAGKGVWVCHSVAEAQQALEEMEQQFGKNSTFLIADRLEGSEVSVIGFIDEKIIKVLPPTQDYKPLLDNNKGLNTGGMGAVCPAPFWTKELEQQFVDNILQPTWSGIQQEKMKYRGVLYFGLIIHENTPYVLEYNVRFGDPEAEVLLPKLDTDLMMIIEACCCQNLEEVDLESNDKKYTSVTMVSGGYPKSYAKGKVIHGLDKTKNVLLFHAGTRKEQETYYTNGGRVLHLVGEGDSIAEAREKAYEACQQIDFEGAFYRKDIGDYGQQ